MALSDCMKCWDTPCTCGWDYRHMSKAARIEQAAVILGLHVMNFAPVVYRIVPDKHPMWTDNDDFGRKINTK